MPDPVPPPEYAAIEFRLSLAERELLARSAPPLEEDLRRKLKVDVTDSRGVVVTLGHEDMVSLSDHLALACDLSVTPQQYAATEALYDRVMAVLDAGEPPVHVLYDLEGVPALVIRQSEVDRLRFCWEGDDAAVLLSTHLSARELREVPVLRTARGLLAAMADAGAVEATGTKLMSWEFVRQTAELLGIADGLDRPAVPWRAVPDEQSVWPLHVVRVFLQGVRLLALRKGQFKVTRRGRALLCEECAGELYEQLFRSYCRRTNWAYLYDRWADRGVTKSVRSFQDAVGLMLMMLPERARTWTPLRDIAAKCLPPLLQLGIMSSSPVVSAGEMLQVLLALPLRDFGLAEVRLAPPGAEARDTLIRVTPLYGKFLRFRLMPQPLLL